MKTKYAQYDEDSFILDFFGDKVGFLCDIGAADGVRYSNSRSLLEIGWSGLLIEPNKSSFSKLTELYKDNKLVILANVCCYKEDKGEIDFFCDTYDGFGQISTMSEEFKIRCEMMYEPKYVTNKIQCKKTSNVFMQNSVPYVIDFLSIDCEGVDFEVLLGIDFSFNDIGLVCIENRDPRIHDFMTEAKYKKVFITDGNVFYGK